MVTDTVPEMTPEMVPDMVPEMFPEKVPVMKILATFSLIQPELHFLHFN